MGSEQAAILSEINPCREISEDSLVPRQPCGLLLAHSVALAVGATKFKPEAARRIAARSSRSRRAEEQNSQEQHLLTRESVFILILIDRGKLYI